MLSIEWGRCLKLFHLKNYDRSVAIFYKHSNTFNMKNFPGIKLSTIPNYIIWYKHELNNTDFEFPASGHQKDQTALWNVSWCQLQQTWQSSSPSPSCWSPEQYVHRWSCWRSSERFARIFLSLDSLLLTTSKVWFLREEDFLKS